VSIFLFYRKSKKLCEHEKGKKDTLALLIRESNPLNFEFRIVVAVRLARASPKGGQVIRVE
jgi:hypothetical protein